MKIKISTILALFSLTGCDKFCENAEGDLIWIKYPHVDYIIEHPKDSIVEDDALVDHLEVDDHEYTYQISPTYLNNETKSLQTLFYKKGYKNKDKIDFNKTVLLNLIGKYGFKDLDFNRYFGYKPRTKPPPLNQSNSERLDANATCYHYECDASVINEDCNPTLNTPESKCNLRRAIRDGDIPFFNGPARFYGQCFTSLGKVTGNIFNIWLGSAWNKNNKLPDIEVLTNAVNFDWGKAASKFPAGKI